MANAGLLLELVLQSQTDRLPYKQEKRSTGLQKPEMGRLIYKYHFEKLGKQYLCLFAVMTCQKNISPGKKTSKSISQDMGGRKEAHHPAKTCSLRVVVNYNCLQANRKCHLQVFTAPKKVVLKKVLKKDLTM